MKSLKELLTLVEQDIKGLYLNRTPKELYLPIDYALSVGGKRIRPALCLLACNLFNKEVSSAVKPAIGLEVFHNFTLLHDDIMDKAPIRRNQPTVHIKWDENTAILSGDAMLIEAYEYFFDLEPHLLAQVLPIFNRTAREVCEGQQFDMNFETRLDVSESEYMEMIRLKTAVLLAGALKIGAIIGGANEHDAQQLYDFGIAMGLAFQLQDDYLDSFGDEATFGKQIGGDIVENKKTYLLIKALEYDSKQIKEIISTDSDNKKEKIRIVKDLYLKHKINEEVRNKALSYYTEAEEILDRLKVEDNKKEELRQILNSLKERIY